MFAKYIHLQIKKGVNVNPKFIITIYENLGIMHNNTKTIFKSRLYILIVTSQSYYN